MRTFVFISCLVAVALAQFPPRVPGSGQAQHFQAIQQPHLPQDTNVLHATAQFFDKFAELKALADAAPDDVPQGGRRPQAQQNFATNQHRFASQPAQQFAPTHSAPPPHPASAKFDVNSEIRTLLDRHHSANPTPAPAPRRAPVPQPQRAPVQHQQRAPVQHQQRAPVQQQRPVQSAFPTFNALNNFAPQQPRPQQPRPQQPRPQAQPRFNQASVQQIDPNVQTHNKHGQLINPKGFPGPLAHTIPAGVGGRVEHTQFTPEVAAAHVALASAHADILSQQAALPPPRF